MQTLSEKLRIRFIKNGSTPRGTIARVAEFVGVEMSTVMKWFRMESEPSRHVAGRVVELLKCKKFDASARKTGRKMEKSTVASV